MIYLILTLIIFLCFSKTGKLLGLLTLQGLYMFGAYLVIPTMILVLCFKGKL